MNQKFIKRYNSTDTIAALATFPSKAALGIIKLSGPRALDIVSKVFKPKNKKNLKKVKTYTLHYGWIIESCSDKKKAEKSDNLPVLLDEVLVSVMRKPHSYTCEDVVEISSHGGVFVVNRILKELCLVGARLALPGEFTYRAVINGRIDLLKAESILDIVDAHSQQGLQVALDQLNGKASKNINDLKDRLQLVFVETEAALNFSEDLSTDTAVSELIKSLTVIRSDITALIKRSAEALILKEGVKCVICGRTNAGKSTLFNRLLGRERVIVSEVAATTRDVVEETIVVRGVPLRICDTAGLITPKDLVTKEAVLRTQKAFGEADLIILLLDNSRALSRDDKFLIKKIKDKKKIIVINKTDLKQKLNLKDLKGCRGRRVFISALKDKGIVALEKAVAEEVSFADIDRENSVFLSAYQRQSFALIEEKISKALRFLGEGYTLDFINQLLAEALDEFSKITGEVLTEDVLETVFSNFCIGK
ncbi:MAG: tRNA uridine-5-carboxymethylaminomethyl(34) synthesis GTPase MnmE [Candidatus Omnitrophica bacterium]|nr:tRNA uridine-5-carboxymethylaminomethyl(34) synthesis GTPase MnmE [Candidatus Omnitrophota bacterium]